jgi:quinol monooxygenase YgiN
MTIAPLPPDPDWTVTVVVGRQGRDDVPPRRIERWLERISDRAATRPGFVRSVIQAPAPPRVDDWVVVYEFMSPQTLQDWLTSPERAALLSEVSDLFTGPARQNLLPTPNPATSVTAVTTFAVDPAHDAAFVDAYQQLILDLPGIDGFIPTSTPGWTPRDAQHSWSRSPPPCAAPRPPTSWRASLAGSSPRRPAPRSGSVRPSS